MKKSVLILSIILIIINNNLSAQSTIQSTLAGGNWNDVNTWEEGIIPGANDTVFINGTVSLTANHSCYDLYINENGILHPFSGNKILTINGNIENMGTLEDGNGFFSLSVKGNIINDGAWIIHLTRLDGNTEQNLSCSNQNAFAGFEFKSFNSSDRIVVGSNIYFENTQIDFDNDTISISKGRTISIRAGRIRNVSIKGDEGYLYMHNGAYIQNANLLDMILLGIVQIGDNNVRFYGDLLVLDTLQNFGTLHSCQVTGNIINNGLIRNGSNDLTLKVTGNLTNNYLWENERTLLNGITSQYLSFAPNVVFKGHRFEVSNSSSIIATTDLVFESTIIELEDTLIMQPQNKLSVTGLNNYLRWGVISGNNCKLEMNGGCHLQSIQIHDVSLNGNVKIYGHDVFLSGDIYVCDTLENKGSSSELHINGDLVNNGIIRNSVNDLRIRITNDLFNNGEITVTEIIFNGNANQNIRLINDVPVLSETKFESAISGSWQWYLNDVALPGATSPTLTLDSVSIADYGIYYCLNMLGDVSRNFVVQTDTKPEFIADLTEACTGETISFTNQTTTGFSIVSYLWDFGDGTGSSTENPEHIYESEGIYSVSLTVFDGYHETTKTIYNFDTIYLTPLTDFGFQNISLGESVVFTDESQDVKKIVNYTTLWANTVLNFSSRYTASPPAPSWWWSEQQVLGEPDVYPNYGDSTKAWAPLTANRKREFIEVAFAESRHIDRVSVYETLKPGSIDTVYVKNESGEWVEVWSGTAYPMPDGAREFIIDFPLTDFNVSAVRIAMNTQAVPYWNEIDAVSVRSPIDTVFHPEVTYLWDVGENGITYNTNGSILHQYSSAGFFDITFTITNPQSCEATISKTIFVCDTPNIAVNLKAFLEGPFESTEMTNILMTNIPVNHPYNSIPWNYTGDERNYTIPDGITDWVLVELRETPFDAGSAISSTIIARQAGFITTNGIVTSIDGSSPLRFHCDVTDNLFAVIYHRNHLGIMSAFAMLPTGNIYTCDFTTGPDKVYGGTDGCKELTTGIWGLTGGDADANGQINIDDKTGPWTVQAGKSGYKEADLNLDKQVNNIDKNNSWWINIGQNQQIPE
jgi:PKD repeat protein